jgi:hypothetical protein
MSGYFGEAPAYNDGSANAPSGTPQYPHLLDGYAVRPPWQVAGVDYAVGIHAGTVLKNPVTCGCLPAGASVDATNHLIRVTADNVTLDGFDFTDNYSIYIPGDPGANGTRIINCAFKVTGFAVNAQGSSANVYVGYCVIDGDSATGCDMGELISFRNGTVVYNWIKNAPQHFLSAGGGGAVVYRYNLLDQGAFCPGAHLNYLQFGGGAYSLVDVEFNTSRQTPQVAGGEGYQFYTNSAGSIDSGILVCNTMIAAGGVAGSAMSYMVHAGSNSQYPGSYYGVVHDNYFDPTAAYGAVYPGLNGFTYCGDINMATGTPIDSACPGSLIGLTPAVLGIPVSAWPNPASGAVTFRFPGEQPSNITITDIQGRLIRKLSKSGIWDGTDMSGTAVRAGVYLYGITVNGATQYGKIIKEK